MATRPSLQIEDFDDKTFNPLAAEALAWGDVSDPHSVLREMRKTSDVHPVGLHGVFMKSEYAALGSVKSYMILGYDACFKAYTDPATFTNAILKKTVGLSFGRSLTAMDAPEHMRYRRIFQKAFLPSVVASWGESVVEPVVESLVSKFEGRGKADLVEDFTRHFPFQVIYKQLDLDAESSAIFHKLAMAQPLTRHADAMPRAIEAGEKLGRFFEGLVREKLKNPGSDLISHMATVEVDGERLPEDVVVSFFRQLLSAAGDTTFRSTSNLLTALLTNPDQLEAVVADRSLVPQAIEEGLRWEGPVTQMLRETSRDVEVDGVLIPKGSAVDLVIMSANHDPEKYSDPDRFDIFRKDKSRAIPFGTGPHVCLGQHLAKLEITRALNAIFDRLPNLRLDPDYPAPVIRGYALRAPQHIHVLFD